MAHYYERDKVHTAPSRASRDPAAPSSPSASRPAASHPEVSRSAASRRAARIDCDTCPIAGHGCGDCMVALLGPVRLRLDDAEQRALGILLECGLVSEQEAGEAYAEPDLPDWVVESWQPSQEIQGGPVHEVQGRATG